VASIAFACQPGPAGLAEPSAAIARPHLSAVQPTQTDKQISAAVDAYAKRQRVVQRIPGLALGVMRNGQLIKVQGYGLANIELDVPVKPQTVFQMGSVGKQFTATAIMLLVEDGRIALDDKISAYFPGLPASWKNVTVRNLLSHTSGIADYAGVESANSDAIVNLRADYSEDELLQKFITLPVHFEPGEKWEYSNTGYVLLGFLIHKVTGEFYGDFLQDRIFRPLGMTSTRIISEADIVPNRAAGYELVKETIKNQRWVSPSLNTTGDGALYTDVLDLAKWDAALDAGKLLKKSSFDQMWTPVTLRDGSRYPYGFGWDVTEVNGHRLLEHIGAWQGFTMCSARYPDDRLTVVVLTNLDAGHADPTRIAHHVAALYLPALKPIERNPIEDKDPQVTALVRATFVDFAAGHPNLDSFDSDQRAIWTPETMAYVSDFLHSLGTLTKVALLERKESARSRQFTYRATFTDGEILVDVALDQNNEISSWQVHPQ
jgi:CubicO group peptidase (beta-lactamase class C family)